MRHFTIVVFSFLLLNAGLLNAQSQEKIYTSMILNFARGIQWPSFIADDKFVIGVFEYPPLANELNIATEVAKISGKKVEVREFAYAEDVTDCHVIFIPAYKAKQVPKVLASLGKKPTLIVTNKPQLAKTTGGINLVLVNGKLQYEINCKSLEEKGMKISSALKSMGIIIQ